MVEQPAKWWGPHRPHEHPWVLWRRVERRPSSSMLSHHLSHEEEQGRESSCISHPLGYCWTEAPSNAQGEGRCADELRPESMPTRPCLQGRQQLLPEESEMHHVRPSARGRAGEPSQEGGAECIVKEPPYGTSGRRPGLPGLSGMEASSGYEPGNSSAVERGRPAIQCVREQSTSSTLEPPSGTPRMSTDDSEASEDRKGDELPCPVWLKRHIYGHLKREEMLWMDLIQYLCHPDVKSDQQHINEVSFVIRQALQNKQPSMKRLTERYHLQPRSPKTVAEVCNPNRFGPYCDDFWTAIRNIIRSWTRMGLVETKSSTICDSLPGDRKTWTGDSISTLHQIQPIAESGNAFSISFTECSTSSLVWVAASQTVVEVLSKIHKPM